LVTRSLNDLYYVHAITRFSIDPFLIAKAFLSGVLATTLAAAIPAFLAARTEPLDLLLRVRQGGSSHAGALRAFGLGLLLLMSAGAVLLQPSLTAGLLSLLLVVLGFSLTVPLFLSVFVAALVRMTNRVPIRMALRGVAAFLGRTSLAAVALTVAVAATISIAMMVSSFRGTLLSWLETTLTADVYVSLKDRAAIDSGASLDPQKVEAAIGLSGVTGWAGQRPKRLPSSTGETYLVGLRTTPEYRESLVFLDLADDGWQEFESGRGVFVTEPYSRRSNLAVGSTLRLSTPRGEKSFPVLGVYYSYAPDRNLALLNSVGFQKIFDDDHWSGLGLYLDDGVDVTEFTTELRRLFGPSAEVRATGNLKLLAMEIFERTFTVTEILRFLALGVAFIGVFLSLLALCFERSDEVRVLRALGMESRELFQLSVVQSAVIGMLAGILAFPLGTLLSYQMIAVINRRAFGWTISFQPDWGATVESLLLALSAALLAGLYPAWYWSHQDGEEALRERE